MNIDDAIQTGYITPFQYWVRKLNEVACLWIHS